MAAFHIIAILIGRSRFGIAVIVVLVGSVSTFTVPLSLSLCFPVRVIIAVVVAHISILHPSWDILDQVKIGFLNIGRHHDSVGGVDEPEYLRVAEG